MSLAAALSRIQDAVAAAAARRGRSPSAVTILAASKTVPPDRMRAAFELGLRRFGENRVQEREAKREALADLPIEWRLLGPLQRNKVGRALGLFSIIETVDSLVLAQRISSMAASHQVPVVHGLLEINIGREPQKSGVLPEAALELALALSALPHLKIRGVMSVPPSSAEPGDARPYFAALAELSDRIRSALNVDPAAWELSMGMSHDFEVAVEEGATEVRIGSSLFGSRPAIT